MFDQLRIYMRGESFWMVEFFSGRMLCELDTKPLMLNGVQVLMRKVEWLEDIIGSMDLPRIKRAGLITPQGEYWVEPMPYTVFQLSRGTQVLIGDSPERIKNCQIIGHIIDKDTGEALAYVWDVQEQAAFQVTFSVFDPFPAWREGVIPVGVLNLKDLDVRLH
jgi:hypothetical protein